MYLALRCRRDRGGISRDCGTQSSIGFSTIAKNFSLATEAPYSPTTRVFGSLGQSRLQFEEELALSQSDLKECEWTRPVIKMYVWLVRPCRNCQPFGSRGRSRQSHEYQEDRFVGIIVTAISSYHRATICNSLGTTLYFHKLCKG